MFILFLVCVLEPLSIGLAVAVSAVWLKAPSKEKSFDPLAEAILRLLNKKGDFIGSVTKLLETLNDIDQEGLCNSRGGPMTPLILGRRLQSKSLKQEFIRNGIYMQNKTKNETIELSKVENK